MNARACYERLRSNRDDFLDVAVECSRLTLPYLIKQDDTGPNRERLKTPWQAVGAKSVTTLAAKLMLALLPPQTTFFKLQVDDSKLGLELGPEVRTDLELGFSKVERIVMDYINASSDRVVVHEAVNHLIVGGNALLYYSKKGLKFYPLNRYVVERDGDGNVIKIVTKELVSREVLGETVQMPKPNSPANEGVNNSEGGTDQDVPVYTYVKMDKKSGRWVWHQEVYDKVIPGSRGTAPKNNNPWMVLRFNTVDGEAYGRGRVEQYLGDIKSLEALSQALIEGSAVAAKVMFLVNPSSTTKPQTLAQAGNGAIVQGRQDDVQVVSVGKQADFATAAQLAQTLSQRISDAFLVLNIRQSERTTAEEVRLTQLELEQQLGGIFSLLTVEFLVPYLRRTLFNLQATNEIPKIPKDIVKPAIVAGVNALGRGQDRQSLTEFITTIAGTMGPEAIMQYINPAEYIKRLAASQGIDVLNLVKTSEEVQGEMQQAQESAQQMEMTKQQGQLASAPMNDPSKNPALAEQLTDDGSQTGPTPEEAQAIDSANTPETA
tara:strand:+ start:1170 stop:2810 length:1641 start_codon:yes stop_codon:yes gene_type:complete